MLCDKCHRQEATVHVTRKTPAGVKVQRSYCESCAEGLGCYGSGESLALFPWEEEAEGSLFVTGQILEVKPEVVVIRVLRSSRYPRGTELAVHSRFVPRAMRRHGAEFSFSIPPDKISSVIVAG